MCSVSYVPNLQVAAAANEAAIKAAMTHASVRASSGDEPHTRFRSKVDEFLPHMPEVEL
jgi:hypothetical protein